MLDRYRDQARLLIAALPYVAEQEMFALKGGTAIILAPAEPRYAEAYRVEFTGMTRDPVSMGALDDTRRRLHEDVRSRLTGEIAAFLLSLHDAKPDFDLIGLRHAEQLPAVRWKLVNLRKLKRENPKKHAAQRSELEALCR